MGTDLKQWTSAGPLIDIHQTKGHYQRRASHGVKQGISHDDFTKLIHKSKPSNRGREANHHPVNAVHRQGKLVPSFDGIGQVKITKGETIQREHVQTATDHSGPGSEENP